MCSACFSCVRNGADVCKATGTWARMVRPRGGAPWVGGAADGDRAHQQMLKVVIRAVLKMGCAENPAAAQSLFAPSGRAVDKDSFPFHSTESTLRNIHCERVS